MALCTQTMKTFDEKRSTASIQIFSQGTNTFNEIIPESVRHFFEEQGITARAMKECPQIFWHQDLLDYMVGKK